jgi:putative ABC transport system permease protein
MKTIIRNFLFVLKRFKTPSILNIIGLSAAFAVFIVVLIQGNYTLNYDRNFKNSDNIYYFSTSLPDGNIRRNMPTPMAKEMADKFPEIKHHCLVLNYTPDDMLVDITNNKGSKQTFTTKVTPVTAGFLDVFTPTIISGSTQGLFSGQGKGLITESQAKKLFGNENPIGKTVYYHFSKPFYNNQKCDFVTIIAVCHDLPKNCSLKNGIFTLLPDDNNGNHNYYGYFLVEKQNIGKLLSELNSEKFFTKEAWQEMQKTGKKIIFSLTPLHQAYFEFEKGRLTTILTLLAIGILTLIIAYINFLNFSIAISPARVKTLNMHKIIGANPAKLKLMQASEAALFSLVAFALALLYIVLLKGSFISEYFAADMALSANWPLLVLTGIVAIALGLLFGWYPAHYIVSFQPAIALRGSFAMSAKSSQLRNILIGIQFTAAIILIIVSLFIPIQNSFMQHRSWGIQKENIVYVPYGQLNIDMHTFGEELKKDPRILDYTASQFLPGTVGMSWDREIDGKPVSAYIWTVEVNFLRFFGVKILAGRDFQDTDSTGNKRALIFNEVFLKTHQLNNDILGKEVFGFDKMQSIVGVAKNINYSSLRDSIRPMAFTVLEKAQMNWFFIKLSGNDIPGAVESISKTWKKYSDENFDLRFVDKTMDNLYKNETNLAKLISIFGLVIIIIAVMGVYGLIVFNTRYKAKEIAIRKVNGASISEIMLMLNRNVLIVLSIAYIISVPVAYYIVHRWLQQFAYKIPIYWWVFALAGLLIFIVTVITVSLQSYKAAATNPVEAVKGE